MTVTSPRFIIVTLGLLLSFYFKTTFLLVVKYKNERNLSSVLQYNFAVLDLLFRNLQTKKILLLLTTNN